MRDEIDLAFETTNDALNEDVATKAEAFRESGQIGDLIRLRDSRVRAGQHLRNTVTETQVHLPNVTEMAEPLAIGADGLPEIDVNDLSIERLQSAMHHHGALIVRNLMSARRAFEFRKKIDHAFEEAKAYFQAEQAGTLDERSTNGKAMFMPALPGEKLQLRVDKMFMDISGAMSTFLSPKVSYDLLDYFEEIGLRALLMAYFQDEPCLSFKKSVLRLTQVQERPTEWHQDGAFMGRGIRSLNLWTALTDCGAGTESPGMDLVPKRLTEVIEPGTNGAIFDWSVSNETVKTRLADFPPVRPFFAAGDAVIFDHFNLHCTSFSPEFSQPRYAIETWFFSKSGCAENQKPVFW